MWNPFNKKNKQPIQLVDNEKIKSNYEQDSSRLNRKSSVNSNSINNKNQNNQKHPRDKYIGSFAPNPAFITFLRLIL